MTPEEIQREQSKVKKFYKKLGYPELDKFDKKAFKFTYYDLIEFAQQYHNSKNEKTNDDEFQYLLFNKSGGEIPAEELQQLKDKATKRGLIKFADYLQKKINKRKE